MANGEVFTDPGLEPTDYPMATDLRDVELGTAALCTSDVSPRALQGANFHRRLPHAGQR